MDRRFNRLRNAAAAISCYQIILLPFADTSTSNNYKLRTFFSIDENCLAIWNLRTQSWRSAWTTVKSSFSRNICKIPSESVRDFTWTGVTLLTLIYQSQNLHTPMHLVCFFASGKNSIWWRKNLWSALYCIKGSWKKLWKIHNCVSGRGSTEVTISHRTLGTGDVIY